MRYPGQTSCDVEEQDEEKGDHPGSIANTWSSEKRVCHTSFAPLPSGLSLGFDTLATKRGREDTLSLQQLGGFPRHLA